MGKKKTLVSISYKMAELKNHKNEKITENEFLEKLKCGYQEMADINLELAKESLECDNEALDNYEKYLSGSED